jgi:hypothetical protein
MTITYDINNLTPLILPKGETLDSFTDESSERNAPPLEGLGEVNCSQ